MTTIGASRRNWVVNAHRKNAVLSRNARGATFTKSHAVQVADFLLLQNGTDFVKLQSDDRVIQGAGV